MNDILITLQGQSWFSILTAAVALASAVAACTNTPAPGSTWSKVYAVLDFIALNIGKAKSTGSTTEVPK